MNEDIKKQLFDFIKETTPNLKEVLELDYHVITTDNNHPPNDGDFYKLVGEYKVKCLISVPDTDIPMNNLFGERERICFVNESEFESWSNRKEAIRWV